MNFVPLLSKAENSGTMSEIPATRDKPQKGKFVYRPEVDGLRAVAVLAVVLFHAGMGLPGGYIGVDVFFVLSGYLITSLLVGDMESGRFTFIGFWVRRSRRILPALVLVVLCALAAGWVLLLPDDYAALGRAAFWQSFFAANFYAWSDTGYFVASADQKPLLHLWSLGVEEQFYLIFPIFLFGFLCWPLLRVNGKRLLAMALAAGIVVSFAFSIYTVSFHPGVAFYWPFSRAWELGLGAALAILPQSAIPRNGILREFLAVSGLAAIILPAVFFSSQTPFPGLAALPCCVGTAVFLLACAKPTDDTSCRFPITARLLTWSPLVGIGLLSYSIYLWHWPLFAFANYWAFEPLSLGIRLALVATAFVFATLSWRLVECPLRKNRSLSPKRVLALAAGSQLVIAAAGTAIVVSGGFPNRPISAGQTPIDVASKIRWLKDMTAADIRSGEFLLMGAPGGEVSVVLWGDSHAMAAAPAVDFALKKQGLTGVLLARSSTPPIPGHSWPSAYYSEEETRDFLAASQIFIEQVDPDLLILAAAWQGYGLSDENRTITQPLVDAAREHVVAGRATAVMLQVPSHEIFIPKAVALQSLFGYDFTEKLRGPGQFSETYRDLGDLPDQLGAVGCVVANPEPDFLGGPAGRYRVERDGIPLYRDGDHLSEKGAILMLAPHFEKLLADQFGDSSE